jgi:23S rRNA pseudouridine2605 synthase
MLKPSPRDEVPGGIRLQKVLASAGVDSRRKSEEYIVTGRVTVDGEVATDPGRKVDPETQDVRLDGERLRPQKKRYYLLNKPPGYLCTNYDPSGRARAVDLIPAHDTRLFTVGRLDESSQGLLLVTNDGDLAQRLAHPRYQVPRVYRVQVAGVPTPETLAQLRKGVHFAEGRFGVRRAKRLKTQGQSTFLEVELTQGQNREIRRLFARFGHKVMWLQRVAFGPLKLGDLPVGRFRPLRPDEVKSLQTFVRAAAERRQPARLPADRTAKQADRPARPEAARSGRRVLDLSGGDIAKRPARQSRPTKSRRKPHR